jgi:hypothetical protein
LIRFKAWIQNATLKENILFYRPWNETMYNQIVEACALHADINILPGEDGLVLFVLDLA